MSWKTVSLGEVASKIDYGLTASANTEEVGPKFLRITDIQDGNVNWKAVPYCRCDEKALFKNELAPGDIVFARTGATTGKSFLIEECPSKTVFASYLIRIKPSKLIDPKYLSFFLQTPQYWTQIHKEARGAAQGGINASTLKKLAIPLPPLEKQKQIAAILDKADGIRRKRQQAMAMADEFLRSVFLDMFGDPVTNPKGWEKHPIADVSIRVTKGESPKWQGFDYQEDGVEFITSENVLWGELDRNKRKFIPQEFHEKLQRSQLKSDDLLINLVGASVGRACLATKDAIPSNINQAVSVTSLDSEAILPSFALQQILTPQIQRRLLGNAVDFARANLSLKNIRELTLIVPPINIQQNWHKIYQQFILTKKRNAAIGLNAGLLFSSLQQRAFRGDL